MTMISPTSQPLITCVLGSGKAAGFNDPEGTTFACMNRSCNPIWAVAKDLVQPAGTCSEIEFSSVFRDNYGFIGDGMSDIPSSAAPPSHERKHHESRNPSKIH